MVAAIKDAAIAALNKDKNPKLMATIDATHSGVITNRRVYPSKNVSTGYKTFYSKDRGGSAEFDKPILKHHDMYNDPIGRVVKAIWTPLKSGRALNEDFLSPDAPGGKGSGVVTVDAIITDTESIEKIIDGRYISVSAGHSTDSMTCSICDKSIMKCDHWPGKYYNDEGEETDAENGFLCFYITGNMTYDELSFVNMPAQPPAKLVNFRWEDFDKTKFEKEDVLVESMTRGKKSMVRNFALVDDDGEFNLLKGSFTDANKKVVVAMNNQASNNCKESDETSDGHQTEPSKLVTAKGLNIAISSDKGTNTMDPDKNKEDKGLDVDTLKESLQALTNEKKRVEAEKTALDQKIVTLEATVASKTSEIERLTKAQADNQAEMNLALATSLASFRKMLSKPDTQEIDSAEKFAEYIGKLSKRSTDSLKDAINDIVVEVNEKKETIPSKNDGAKSLVANGKITNPSQVDTKDSIVQAGKEDKNRPSKTKDAKNAVDKAFD